MPRQRTASAMRGLSVVSITRFKGLNRYTSLVELGPDEAAGLLNVITSPSGVLEKFRLPTDITTVIDGQPAGPEQIFDFSQPTQLFRSWVVTIGQKIYGIDPTTFAITVLDSQPAYANARWDAETSNNILFLMNGKIGVKYLGALGGILPWGYAAPGLAPTFAASSVIGLIGILFNQGGRSYRYAWKSALTGGISSASPASPYTGNGTLLNQVTAGSPAPNLATTGIDTIVWYATLDGGATWFLHHEDNIAANGISFIDNSGYVDVNLDTGRSCSFINGTPPVAKYLAKFQSRIFFFNLVGDPQSIAYTGYEKILEGRPEEAVPPNNRLRLAIGADEIRGGGVTHFGVVAWSSNDRMYMFRGIVEDIIVNAPINFTAYLEELPFNIGLYSHWTVQATPMGLTFMASDRTLMNFTGATRPADISGPVYPLLKRITSGSQDIILSTVFNWLERSWYVLLFPIDGSMINNRILFLDLTTEEGQNSGYFIVDVQADSIAVVEDAQANRRLMIGQGGKLRELKVAEAMEQGIHTAVSSTSGFLNAYWRSGPFGNAHADFYKIWRYLDLVADQGGFKFNVITFDDNVTAPTITDLGRANGRVSVGIKSRRMQVEIQFPQEDVSASVLELRVASRITGER